MKVGFVVISAASQIGGNSVSDWLDRGSAIQQIQKLSLMNSSLLAPSHPPTAIHGLLQGWHPFCPVNSISVFEGDDFQSKRSLL